MSTPCASWLTIRRNIIRESEWVPKKQRGEKATRMKEKTHGFCWPLTKKTIRYTIYNTIITYYNAIAITGTLLLVGTVVDVMTVCMCARVPSEWRRAEWAREDLRTSLELDGDGFSISIIHKQYVIASTCVDELKRMHKAHQTHPA